MTRIDRWTVERKKPTYYRSFVNSFDRNPLTGLIATVTNEDSVKQSLQNLILTNIYERYEQPYIGSKLQSLLFDPMDAITEDLIKDTITETIVQCEPRCELIAVKVLANSDLDSYDVTIVFSLINIPEQLTLNLVLMRIR